MSTPRRVCRGGGYGDNSNGDSSNCSRPPSPCHGSLERRPDGLTWTKRAAASRHFLHSPPAIAVDLVDLTRARRAGVITVEVYDDESGAVYAVPLASFDAHGFTLERGHGPQVALPLARWKTVPPGQLALPLEVVS